MVMRHLFKKNRIVWITVAVLSLALIPVGYRCAIQKTCKSGTVEKAVRGEAVVQLPKGMIYAEVVDTPASRAQGLSGRKTLGEKEGMLFVFEQPGRYGFWMKDMLFPIDIMWINDDGIVVHVEGNVSPSTYAVTDPPQTFINEPEARFVLELPARQAEKLGAHLGTKVRIVR